MGIIALLDEGGEKKGFTLSTSVLEMPWKGAVGGRHMERVFGRTTRRETCGKRVATSRRELDLSFSAR